MDATVTRAAAVCAGRLAAVAAMGPEGWTREYNKSLAAAKAKVKAQESAL